MPKTKAELFERRRFLHGMTLAAGAASFSPQFFGSTAAAISIPAKVEAAASEAGQTTRLAEYAVGLRYEEIPAEVLQRAKDCIADTVGTILFGSQFPWSKMIIAQARRMGTGGSCAILGTGARVCALAAALAHGAMTHAFEQDNLTFPDSGVHPGASLVSSGLAVAQESGMNGRDLLTSFVAGAEVMIRIGRATKRTNEARGFHAPGTLGPFGAAVASGKLMRFDATKMTNALGIAGSTSGGLLEFAHSGNGAMVKRLHLGRAAEGGVLAASLAADGFTGPSTVLEGGGGISQGVLQRERPRRIDARAQRNLLDLDNHDETLHLPHYCSHRCGGYSRPSQPTRDFGWRCRLNPDRGQPAHGNDQQYPGATRYPPRTV
jgi:2-methylcitrate dehydratase PrpD